MSYNRILAERGQKRIELIVWLVALLIQIFAFVLFYMYVR